ncbi:uncharacterized protein [Physeter macrocephalus]|uniref:Uncharacterized protein n=1 Tax=Physeter macrocephalus TaxID=9755 RepID=A0A9W2WWM3_PHYMC|nr:uncharacterized protein LOC129392479 [Physeter catodon]
MKKWSYGRMGTCSKGRISFPGWEILYHTCKKDRRMGQTENVTGRVSARANTGEPWSQEANKVIQGPRPLPHIGCSKYSVGYSESGQEMRGERSPAENLRDKFRGHVQCHIHSTGQRKTLIWRRQVTALRPHRKQQSGTTEHTSANMGSRHLAQERNQNRKWVPHGICLTRDVMPVIATARVPHFYCKKAAHFSLVPRQSKNLQVKNPGRHCLSQVMKVNLTPVISHVPPTYANVMS